MTCCCWCAISPPSTPRSWPPRFTEASLETLRRYPWPGNVREIENLEQRLLAMVEGGTIEVADLPAGMRSDSFFDEQRPGRTLAEVEREYVQRVLERCGGDRSRAARLLSIQNAPGNTPASGPPGKLCDGGSARCGAPRAPLLAKDSGPE